MEFIDAADDFEGGVDVRSWECSSSVSSASYGCSRTDSISETSEAVVAELKSLVCFRAEERRFFWERLEMRSLKWVS